MFGGINCFALGWIGHPSRKRPLSDWREAGRRAVAAAVHYFQGAWRNKFEWCGEKYNKVTSRQALPWIDTYREGLALALAYGDWKSADQIIAWPGPDVRFDDGSFDRTREDNAYYIWLASRLRGETESSAKGQRKLASRTQKRSAGEGKVVKHALRKADAGAPSLEMLAMAFAQRELISRGSRRRPKMLLEAADGLLAGDKKGLAVALTKYIKHYRQREFDLKIVENAICIDATILWHWARRVGLGEIELPEELMVFIPRP